MSDEVAEWYLSLGTRGRAFTDRAFDRPKVRGPELAMPHSRGLGDGLRELRFTAKAWHVVSHIISTWTERLSS